MKIVRTEPSAARLFYCFCGGLEGLAYRKVATSLICKTRSAATIFLSVVKYAMAFFIPQFGNRQIWALDFATAKLPLEKDPPSTSCATGMASRGQIVRPTTTCHGGAFGSVMKRWVALESDQWGVSL